MYPFFYEDLSNIHTTKIADYIVTEHCPSNHLIPIIALLHIPPYFFPYSQPTNSKGFVDILKIHETNIKWLVNCSSGCYNIALDTIYCQLRYERFSLVYPFFYEDLSNIHTTKIADYIFMEHCPSNHLIQIIALLHIPPYFFPYSQPTNSKGFVDILKTHETNTKRLVNCSSGCYNIALDTIYCQLRYNRFSLVYPFFYEDLSNIHTTKIADYIVTEHCPSNHLILIIALLHIPP